MSEGQALGLCLLDCVPNLGFLVGGYFLVRVASIARHRAAAWLMGCGVGLVSLGGILQLAWKAIYTVLLLGDPRVLSDLQFVLLAPGFLLMFASAMIVLRVTRNRQASAAAAIAVWKIPLLVVMTLSSLGLHGALTVLSLRRRARLAAALFALTAVILLAMAGLASGEQTVARQWTEESINSVGQLAFAAGSYLLYRRYRQDALTSERETPQAVPARAS